MIYSMTAFGRGVHRTAEREVTAEIRSVNNRFLDCTVKLPRVYSFLEDKVKSYLSGRGVARGKVDVYIGVENLSSVNSAEITLDEDYTEAYIAALRELSRRFGLPDDITTMRVAANPEVFRVKKPEHDAEKDWQLLLPALADAADVFLAARAAEGAKIEKDIRGKLAGIEAVTPEIAALSDEDVRARRDKLRDRIGKLLGEEGIVPDEGRLLTECALFADKIAIDEELVRLSVYGEGAEGYLGVMGPRDGELYLSKKLSRSAVSGFPGSISFAARAGETPPALSYADEEKTESVCDSSDAPPPSGDCCGCESTDASGGERADDCTCHLPAEDDKPPPLENFAEQSIAFDGVWRHCPCPCSLFSGLEAKSVCSSISGALMLEEAEGVWLAVPDDIAREIPNSRYLAFTDREMIGGRHYQLAFVKNT